MQEVELQQLGSYKLTELLRTSSTSSFYRGKQRKKDFLLKKLNVPLTTTEAKGAFLARAKQLKKLKDRNIHNVVEANFAGDYAYLVMDYVEAETLRERIPAGKRIAPDEVKQYLSPIADAIHRAHVNNVMHNNLHPGNLLAAAYSTFLLTDFSLALPGLDLVLDDEDFAVPYKAPEALQGNPTFNSDQYSLAVIAYEWLCGRRPFDATERELLLQQQQSAQLPAPRSLNEAISPAVERVLLQALSYDPAERFAHTFEFSNQYLSALMGFPIKVSSAPVRQHVPSTPIQESVNGNGSHAPIAPVPAETILRTEKMHSEDVAASLPESVTSAAHDSNLPAQSETERPLVPPAKKGASPLPTTDARLQSIIEQDLQQGGVLSQSLSGYEERVAQVEMATVVARALTQSTPAILEAGTGTGKALDVDTPIATPTGWERMGDLIEGDFVFDEKGQPTHVTAAFDVMYDRTCYEVAFSDGSSLIADAEHEWVSYTTTDRKWTKSPRTPTYAAKTFVTADKLAMIDRLIALTKDNDVLSVGEAEVLLGGHDWSIYQATRKIAPVNAGGRPARYPQHTLLTDVRERLARDLVEQHRDGRTYTLVTTEKMAATLTVGASKRNKHAIAVAGPLVLPEAELPVTPYFLGVWLGDGSCRNNQITTADPDINAEIEKEGYTVRPLKSNPYLYAVDDENGKAVSRWQPGMTGRLRKLGVLLNKHIPVIYLRAFERQRRDLLAGLLDTDGTVNRGGAIEFTTTSPKLSQDVYELVCSLGFRASVRFGRACLNGKDCGPKWTISFTTAEPVFRLKRKVIAQKERLLNYNAGRNCYRYVVAVREVPTRPVRCIQVEAASHLYLAGRAMIPTHNSLAYLVPIVRSGKVAIVSTANKALQEQLFYKDIPFVQQHIKPFEAALVKGVNNYVCIDRLETERVGMQFYAKNRDFKRLLDIVNDPESTFSGDFETLGFQLSGDIRSKVATDSDQCAWSKCSFFGECYVRMMRERAERAKVIVVNHTLLLLDAAMDGFLLPERDVIVLDEAHHLEEEATRSFTVTISPMQVQTLLAQRMLKDHTLLRLQDETLQAAEHMWSRLYQVANPGYKGRANLEAPLEEGLRLATVISDLADSLRKQRPKDMPEREGQLYDKLLKRAQNLAENVRMVFSVAERDKFVYYVERVEASANRVTLQASAAPLDVTKWLKERLFNKCNVICTSATLATIGPNPARPEEKGPNFAYFRRRVGLDPLERSDVLERILPLAFDYEENALLYLPRDLPEPAYGAGSDDYMKAIAREMYRLVKLSRGRAFLLFSSKRMLDRAYELMAPHLPYPLLKQGDMTRIELTRRFREEEGSVLFGLKSFWEGVDIAGEALSLVVIDKLPFDPPDDPVHEARVAMMKAAGENWFGTYVLPQAVLRLKQGIGRLLRTRDDRGVMAILDTRLHTKGYGKLVLNALPPARRTSSLRDVERFFSDF